ncbi:MAG TPA: gamma-glutamyl-gamma-aminobutyrate hydrolase family protein [Saprospiraceae bacterium]|nr:gamma-glutamyl-gamma-aminobutyrate hydrolase family protein [Saprospiraceae bacterium]
MKKIGITQRVDHRKDINEKRDCLDQRWIQLAQTIGVILIPVPNTMRDPIGFVKTLNIEGIIFSGGNHVGELYGKVVEKKGEAEVKDVFTERDRTEYALLTYALRFQIPLLGVCRGMQMIYSYFGGDLKKVDHSVHVARRHSIHWASELMVRFYNNQKEVNSYHGFGIESPVSNTQLEVTGIYHKEVESFKVKDSEVYGVMWHPEREEPFSDGDVQLLKYIFKIDEPI